MAATQAIRTFVRAKETLQLHAYDDGTGNWAIGYGHTWHKGDPTPITPAQAEGYFESDILIAEAYIARHITAALLQCEYDALVSLIFNTGEIGPSVLIFLNQGNKIEAASWLGRYCHSGKTALRGLLIRRLQEAQIFLGERVVNY